MSVSPASMKSKVSWSPTVTSAKGPRTTGGSRPRISLRNSAEAFLSRAATIVWLSFTAIVVVPLVPVLAGSHADNEARSNSVPEVLSSPAGRSRVRQAGHRFDFDLHAGHGECGNL